MSDIVERLKAAIAGRYTLERELGAGGMATVYLARDIKHDRDVALKVLRPELAATLGPERFLQEIRIAAKLTHPHILPVHDSGEAGGFLYYVMPYIQGESLREKIRREGELPVDEAVRIVREILDALSHAHAQGVVHRDIKPDNVLISGRHAMVMDFGVAKAVSEATGREKLTTAGVALGTPSYMAPEQAAASPTIDHRADIYAVGALAYELLAGRPPFTGASSQIILAAHVTQTPDPVTAHRAAVPAPLAEVVMRCLAKKPADRWQTAEELLPQLEALSTASGGITPTTMQPVVTIKGVRRKQLAMAGVAVAAVVGLVAVVMPWGNRGSDLVEDRVLVAVLGNETGDPSLDPVGKIAADLLARGLQDIGLVEVVDPRAALTQSESGDQSPRGRARSVAAGTVVSGEYYRVGDSLRFQVQFMETESGRLLHSLDPVAASTEDPMDGLALLEQRVLAAVAAHYSPEMAEMGGMVSFPVSYAAYQEYITGVELFWQSNLPAAATRLAQAVALDPDFAIAAGYLAVVYMEAGQYAAADSIVASVNENRERLTAAERSMMDWLEASVDGDLAEAHRAMLRTLEVLPNGLEVVWTAGLGANNLNRPREALQHLTRLNPREGFLAVQTWLSQEITEAHHLLGEHEAELDAARRGREQFPDRLSALECEARALAAMGRIEDVTRLIDEALTLPPEPGITPAGTMRNTALELRAHGYEDAALELLERAIEWYEARPGEWRAALALTLRVARRWEDAREIYEVLAGEFPNDRAYSAGLGIVAARLGDREAAARADSVLAADDRPYLFGAPEVERAKIAAAAGDRDRAMTLLQNGFRLGSGYSLWLHREPAFDGMWDYPSFQELVRPKG